MVSPQCKLWKNFWNRINRVLIRSEIARAAIAVVIMNWAVITDLSFAQQKYWIIFSDKGPGVPASGLLHPGSALYDQLKTDFQPHALTRRAKVLPSDALLSGEDLPLYSPYLERVKRAGAVIAQESRWFNAVSAVLTDTQVQTIRILPFVQRLEPVRSFAHVPSKVVQEIFPAVQSTSSFDYGPSLFQLRMVNILPLHSMGIDGEGVIIGMLDTGFRWRVHEALQNSTVLAEYDFIFHDDITANQAVDNPVQDFHGTLTMSLIGGYKPGTLIGASYKSSFILGKTEDIRSETRVEEDNWAAGIEWMERQGVDVVSSSLGYNIFDDGTGYTWADGDFNGRTSITARAAVRAAELGVLVCNSMGNEGNGDGIEGTMLTPADADSIISVGWVDFTRALSLASSTGPTNDGRTKPDVVAPGGPGVIFAVPPDGYSQSEEGTSLSTPFAAGSAALILSARPELTPMQVLNALRNNADTIDASVYSTVPNNFTGWGLVNAFKAALTFGPLFSNEPTLALLNGQNVIRTDVVSQFGIRSDSVLLQYTVGKSAVITSVNMVLDSTMFFPTSGRYHVTLPVLDSNALVRFYIDVVDSSGRRYRSPAPINTRVWEFHYGTTSLEESPLIPKAYALYQNYPNPFNGSTIIEYDLPASGMVNLKVYDILGREIATLYNGYHEGGTKIKEAFNASNLPSGVYFYRLRTASFTGTKKMVIMR